MRSSGSGNIHPDFSETFRVLEHGAAAERTAAAVDLSRKFRDLADSGHRFSGDGFTAMVPELKRYSTDDELLVRSNAIEALGWLKPDGITLLLRRRLVSEHDADTKVSIHFALARLGDAASRDSIKSWANHHDKGTRHAAIVRASNLGLVEVLPALEEHASPDKDYEDRMHAIYAIGRLGRRVHPVTRVKLLAVLNKYRQDADEDIANEARIALNRLRNER